jgi:hypothetical protein
MKRRRAQDRLRVDAGKVHDAIRNNPGIGGKNAIAAVTGLSRQRVGSVIERINAGETGHTRVEYGKVKARGGPNAGEVVRGWFAMNLKRHHEVMDQADEHGARVELGVRRSRLVRFAQAQGIRGAEQVVASIEERLGLEIEAMTETDLAAFEELLADEAVAADQDS